MLAVFKCFIFSYTLPFLIFKYFLLILSSVFPPKSRAWVHFVERYLSLIFFGSNTTKKCQIQTEILMKKTLLVNYANIYRWKIMLIFPLIITNEKTSIGEYRIIGGIQRIKKLGKYSLVNFIGKSDMLILLIYHC